MVRRISTRNHWKTCQLLAFCQFNRLVMVHLQALPISVLWYFLCLFNPCKAQNGFADNAKLSNDSLLWGPYRPNLYFGIRPRLPKSLLTGLLWAKVDSFDSVQHSMLVSLAHSCPFWSEVRPSSGLFADDGRRFSAHVRAKRNGWLWLG